METEKSFSSKVIYTSKLILSLSFLSLRALLVKKLIACWCFFNDFVNGKTKVYL